MTYEAQKVGKLIKGFGQAYKVAAPLDKQIEAFKAVGIQAPYLAAPEKVAQIRLAGISDDGSRTSIAPIAIKGGRTVLVRDSPLMNPLLAASAVQAHRNGKYFIMGKEIYEIAESQAKGQAQAGIEPEDRTAVLLLQEEDFSLAFDAETTRFLLGKHSQNYFEKKVAGGKSGKIQFYNLSSDSKDNCIVNYLWFNGPRSDSGFGAGCRDLVVGDGAFGVLVSGEASAQKNGYDLTTIRNANLQNVHEVMSGIPALEKAFADSLNTGLMRKLKSA